MRQLLLWDNAMSDGCSVPALLRLIVPQESLAQCKVCQHHDEAYYYGGSRADRRGADAEFRAGLSSSGMSAPKAWCYWIGVRFGGSPWYRVPNVSWAFGGAHFKYTPEPAGPRVES